MANSSASITTNVTAQDSSSFGLEVGRSGDDDGGSSNLYTYIGGGLGALIFLIIIIALCIKKCRSTPQPEIPKPVKVPKASVVTVKSDSVEAEEPSVEVVVIHPPPPSHVLGTDFVSDGSARFSHMYSGETSACLW
ncbi:uncharacterized protein [Littorina saxatilis]|uniref:Uncharacterized protein n=1 Tax=Littorina saxatilis TaxID=31220 RepID=A0AAN9BHY7_9CAEN